MPSKSMKWTVQWKKFIKKNDKFLENSWANLAESNDEEELSEEDLDSNVEFLNF